MRKPPAQRRRETRAARRPFTTWRRVRAFRPRRSAARSLAPALVSDESAARVLAAIKATGYTPEHGGAKSPRPPLDDGARRRAEYRQRLLRRGAAGDRRRARRPRLRHHHRQSRQPAGARGALCRPGVRAAGRRGAADERTRAVRRRSVDERSRRADGHHLRRHRRHLSLRSWSTIARRRARWSITSYRARPQDASAMFRGRSGTATRSAVARVSRPDSRPPDSILERHTTGRATS